MKIPSSALRIQICKCIVDFYHAEPLKKQIPGTFFIVLSMITFVFGKQKKISLYISLTFQQTGLRVSIHKKDKSA